MSLTAATVLVGVATFLLALVTVITLLVTGHREKHARREERRAKEDYEARLVVVKIEAVPQGRHPELTHQITVSAPRTYPVTRVEAQLAGWSIDAEPEDMEVRPLGFRPDLPSADDKRIYFRFPSPSPAENMEFPIVRWVDWHGNIYYQYRDYTERFRPKTEWGTAARKNPQPCVGCVMRLFLN
jgi:hypothetical protein